jgi:hypothetical protein
METILVDFEIPSSVHHETIIDCLDKEIFQNGLVICLSKIINDIKKIRINVEISTPPFIGQNNLITSIGTYNATIYYICDAPMF